MALPKNERRSSRHDREQRAITYDLWANFLEEPASKEFCHEGPYCLICHSQRDLVDYLASIPYAKGLVFRQIVLTHNLLSKLDALGSQMDSFQWLIINQAYAGDQLSKGDTLTLFKDFKALFSNSGFQYLNKLAIFSQEFGDEELLALTQSPYLKNLEELMLSHNRITAEGVQLILQCSNLQKLKVLDLSYNQLDYAAILELLYSNKLPELEELYLAGYPQLNYIPSKKMKKGIRKVDFSGSRICFKFLKQFVEENPQLEVLSGFHGKGYPLSALIHWISHPELEDMSWVSL